MTLNYLEEYELLDQNVSKTSANASSLMNNLANSFNKRHENVYMHRLGHVLAQHRYKRRIIRLEDFIDDVYQLDEKSPIAKCSFKLLIQTDPLYCNLIEDFLQYKRLLGEIIYTKLYNSDQWVIIVDIAWFFIVTNKIIAELDQGILELRTKGPKPATKSESNITNERRIIEVEYDENKNIYFAKLAKLLRKTEFLDDFVIHNQPQAEMIMSLLRQFDMLIRVENQVDNLLILPNYLSSSLAEPSYSAYDYDSQLVR